MTRTITVKVPSALVEAIDELVAMGFFENRSAAIREAMRQLIAKYRVMVMR